MHMENKWYTDQGEAAWVKEKKAWKFQTLMKGWSRKPTLSMQPRQQYKSLAVT